MSEGTKKRRTERSGALTERFSNKWSVERCVFQDKKDFTLDIPINYKNRVYGKSQKIVDYIFDDRLFHTTTRQPKKVMTFFIFIVLLL